MRRTLYTFALVALFGTAPARFFAAPARAQAPPPPAAAAPPADQLPSQLHADALTWLTDLLRINTTNPPGNELEAAKYVAAVLQKENIPAEVLELAPGRGAVIGRLQAGPLPDPSKALLLFSHLDVVGVDKSKWTVDPFGAVSKDGYLYGRGAIDDKGMVAANLAVIVALKRSGARLNRDVVFLADDDEEQGGAAGIKILTAKYWDKIAGAFAINEGGFVTVQGGKVLYAGVQASEKIPYNVTVLASGTSGQASVPRPDNAVVHLAAAVQKIAAWETPVELTTVARRYFEQLAAIEDEDTGKWMRALETPERLDLAVRRLADISPVWNAMLRDTVTPTELTAGARANVVPSEARANLNIRLLPGESIQAFVAQMQKLVADPQIRFHVEDDAGMAAPPSSLESDFYAAIARATQQQFPGAVAVPAMSPYATDSTELRLHNVQSYGLVPFPLTEADQLRMHADDERLPLASFHTGVEFLYRIVHNFAAPPN